MGGHYKVDETLSEVFPTLTNKDNYIMKFNSIRVDDDTGMCLYSGYWKILTSDSSGDYNVLVGESGFSPADLCRWFAAGRMIEIPPCRSSWTFSCDKNSNLCDKDSRAMILPVIFVKPDPEKQQKLKSAMSLAYTAIAS